MSIGDIKNLSVDEVIQKIYFEINSYQGYHPKPVKRVEIPKPNGKTRPLGIPSIWYRLIQQCIKQVMEPICEAKFNGHIKLNTKMLAKVNRLRKMAQLFPIKP